jgi:DNA-binding response OmpR family regulator
MSHPGMIYTKAQIYESVAGDFFESDENTLMVHISNLRNKVEDDPKNPTYIKTIRGLGYKIEK